MRQFLFTYSNKYIQVEIFPANHKQYKITRNKHRTKQTQNQTDSEHQTKTFNHIDTKHKKDDGDNNSRQIRIPYCTP